MPKIDRPEALASKKIWLDKKDEIRENNPYNDADEEINNIFIDNIK